jgi:hypothetical protein
VISLSERIVKEVQDRAQEIFIACERIDFSPVDNVELFALWDELGHLLRFLEYLSQRGKKNAESRRMEGSSLPEGAADRDV